MCEELAQRRRAAEREKRVRNAAEREREAARLGIEREQERIRLKREGDFAHRRALLELARLMIERERAQVKIEDEVAMAPAGENEAVSQSPASSDDGSDASDTDPLMFEGDIREAMHVINYCYSRADNFRGYWDDGCPYTHDY
nr:hypothetical protein B0A51_01618 [Rachicladosporium sp. CCFEE 5018]